MAAPSGVREQAERMVADAIILERAQKVLARRAWTDTGTWAVLRDLARKLREEAAREH